MSLVDAFVTPVLPERLQRKQSRQVHLLQEVLVRFLHRQAIGNGYREALETVVARRPLLEYLARKHGFRGYTARMLGGTRVVKLYELPCSRTHVRLYTDLNHRVYVHCDHESIRRHHGRFHGTVSKVLHWGNRPTPWPDDRLERHYYINRAIVAVTAFLSAEEATEDSL